MQTVKAEFWLCNGIEVEVGTDAPQGGDNSTTVVNLRDVGGTSMQADVTPTGINLTFWGDSEQETLVQALRWAADAIEEQAKSNSRK